MPTSLTSKIYDGTDMSFRSYALKCAAQLDYAYSATDSGTKELPQDKAPVLEPSKWNFLGAYDAQKVTKLRIEKLKRQEDMLAARIEKYQETK